MTAVLDPTTLAPAELLAAGVILSGYCSADMRPSSGAVWRSHSEYLKANRAADEIERSAARRAAMAHLGGHDSLAGLVLPRSFPCLGSFRIVDDDGKRPATVACDRCGFRLGVTQKALAEAAEGAAW
jgi:hypothetical protein